MPYTQNLQKVVNHLFNPVEGQVAPDIYAILDAARDESIYKKIQEAGFKDGCLYHGTKAVELAEVAPYLLHLKPDDTFTEWLMNNGWGNSWGIFLESSASPDQLKRHFRKFLTVYDEDGNPLYFRFYDPRVFRVYLPTCNAKELETIFGPVIRYCFEGKDGSLIEFRCANEFQLMQNVVKV
ncbi:MAG: DUF4123 domain-containing protein [Nitrospirae bacterium]|nr:DUF4123 domain-containing protein [Nitrospirota bacterium]